MSCQFDMAAKFMTEDIEENEVSNQLKNKLKHSTNCYVLNRSDYIKSMMKFI